MPLQVAVARLLGYRWPAELEDPHPNPLPEGEGTERMRLSDRARELVKRCDELLPLADEDGLVCLPAVRGESAAADRLLNLLAKAFEECRSPPSPPEPRVTDSNPADSPTPRWASV